jgi:hypothetical protein
MDGEGDVWFGNEDGTLTACEPVHPSDTFASRAFDEVAGEFCGLRFLEPKELAE